MTIAQRFIAGDKAGKLEASPGGTIEDESLATVQSSLRDSIIFATLFPSNKLPGYCHESPLRDSLSFCF